MLTGVDGATRRIYADAMCGRGNQHYSWAELHDLYDLSATPARNLQSNYNLAPTQDADILVPGENGLELRRARFGLVPFWAKEINPKYSMFNAKAEEIEAKPAFREPFKQRRCLVPFSGYYEWKGPPKAMQSYYFHRTDGPIVTLAGVWDRNSQVGDDEVLSFAIITCAPNQFAARYHNRMPVVLERDEFAIWLEQGGHALLDPANDGVLAAYPVSRDVGNVKNNRPDLTAPIEL